MLFVGDIHINAKQSTAILRELQSFVEAFPEEKNIVFLGDYMYMFSYDRQALADLFDFFLSLRDQGKNVYIMAGNHDWLNQHFIYHEWKKIADILNARTSDNKIYFITEPGTYIIDNQEFLLLPYNKEFLFKQKEIYKEKFANHIAQYDTTTKKEKRTATEEILQPNDTSLTHELLQTGELSPSAMLFNDSIRLLASKNANEQLSWAVNMFLFDWYLGDWAQTEKEKKAILIHHYYTANTSFPGQFAKFDYKDIALHPAWMSIPPTIISWHLHKAFTHEQYVCTGSVRYTTSTERDHTKWLRQYNPTTNQRQGKTVMINPYITIDIDTLWGSTPLQTTETGWLFSDSQDANSQVTTDSVEKAYIKIYEDHKALFPENITPGENIPMKPENSTLLLYSQKNMSEVEPMISSELKDSIHDLQYKQTRSTHPDMSELLDISQYNLQQSLLDWKELVKKYLLSRYWTESEKYRTLLSELNIL